MTFENAEKSGDRAPVSTLFLLLFAGIKLAIHLLVNAFPPGHFEIFRDELYYLDCARHLAWGYVDQPPLIAIVARVAAALGTSVFAVRLLPALAGAAKVFLSGVFARKLGGGKTAVTFACLGMILAPANLLMDTLLTMNAFEGVFWTLAALTAFAIVRGADRRLWLFFGLLCGVGTLNKYSMVFFAACLVGGLLVTPERRALGTVWFPAAVGVAAVIVLPNFLWQQSHAFPFLQLMRTIARHHRDVRYGPLAFLITQAVAFSPATAPIWFGGIGWMIAAREARPARFLGWTYLLLFGVFVALGGKYYYLFPIYPIAFGAGGVAVERLASRWRARRAILAAYAAAIVAMGALLLPNSLPVLSEEKFVAWNAEVTRALGLEPKKIEHQPEGELPQLWADMHGWSELANAVAKAYRELSPADQRRCGIYLQNYGQAGAIDFYGRPLKLPPAICGHQNYSFWGPHGYTGELLLVVSRDEATEREHFSGVVKVGEVDDRWQRPDERMSIFLCRGLHGNLAEIWPRITHWD